MIGLRLVRLVPVCLVLLRLAPASAAPVAHLRLDHASETYEVAADLTYVETVESDVTLLTQRGLRGGERAARSFYPEKQSLEVLEAWVDQPDGSRVEVAPSSIFTRPSGSAQNAPGFSGAMTTTVLFPQLAEGSRTHIKWRHTQKTPPMLGFNAWNEAYLEGPTISDETTIILPADIPLHWRARGGFAVAETTTDGMRRITARIENHQGQEVERYTVATSDFQPLFLATTLPNLEAIGAIYHRQSAGRAAVTPEIAAAAARIVTRPDGSVREGLDAARAIYDWVAGTVRYVAVYLNPDDGWVPHPAEDVLRAGYGDCKDHVVLMQALLAARGIRAEGALIDWGARYADLPLWMPGQF
ncbi:MAG TPA: DUF3857 and transglutaminase domain-containing protein, partial [Acetobacteraceae bacterium]